MSVAGVRVVEFGTNVERDQCGNRLQLVSALCRLTDAEHWARIRSAWINDC